VYNLSWNKTSCLIPIRVLTTWHRTSTYLQQHYFVASSRHLASTQQWQDKGNLWQADFSIVWSFISLCLNTEVGFYINSICCCYWMMKNSVMCDRPQPEFDTWLRYSRGSIWTGCFGFESISGVSSIQKRSLGHRTILYKLYMCSLRFRCYARQGSQHAVAVWGMSATTRHRKRGLFLWNLSQRENLRVASGDVREEVCTLYRWGRGYAACSRKAVVVLGLTTKGVKLLCGRKKQ
jgi:hypothetical protein